WKMAELTLNDFVDMTTAIADHEHDLDDSSTRGGARDVQVEYGAACAVGFNRVGAGFPCREIGLAHCSKAVACVITLREVTLAVESRDTCDNLRWTVRRTCRSVCRNAEGVLTLERRVRAPPTTRISRDADGQTGNHYENE